MEQFITMDPAFAEGSLDLRQKTYLWHAQGELPSERSRLKSLQSDWWWSRDDAAIAASKQRIVRLTSTIENFHDTDIQYKDIHSGDESVAWSGTKGFGNGLKTGAKANVNGLSSAGVGLVTLGYVDGVEVWTVQQDDIDGGYGTALIVARGGGELLLVATPTGLASIAGKAGKLGTAARYGSYAMRGADVATNAHDASESAYRMMSEKDFSFANIAQFATSTMGFAGDYSDLNKVLDKAGYKITFSGVASGAPMHIGQVVPRSAMPGNVAFSQRTVGGNVTEYADDMSNGRWDWSRSGPINVMRQGDRYVTFDNRRLLAAREANLPEIRINVVDPKAIRPNTAMTWEEAFRRRFNDPRNKRAGGIVPNGGIMEPPTIAPKQN